MDYRPQLTGKRELDEPLRKAFDFLYELRAQVRAIPRPEPPLTLANISQQLQAGGSHPLNLGGLSGVSTTAIPTVGVLPASGALGQPVIYLGALWTWTGSRWTYEAGVMEALLASRPAALGLGGAGFLFWATDAKLLHYWTGSAWRYMLGIYQRTQAQLAALAATLTAEDAGLLVDVTDYAHVLRWTGTAWAYDDPADPAGPIASFLVDPLPTTGWHLCDGTAAVPYLKSDGSLGTQNLPDLVSAANKAAYAKLGSPASAVVNPAVAPTLSGGSIGSEAAHTHSVTVASGTTGAPSAETATLPTEIEEHNHTFLITSATNASPIRISTAGNPHGLHDGDFVIVDLCTGNTAANGLVWSIAVVSVVAFDLIGSTGNGAYTGNGIFYGPLDRASISNATNAAPIVITSPDHGLVTGDKIRVVDCTGNTAANGDWVVTFVDANHVSLDGSTGNGAYTGNGHLAVLVASATHTHNNNAGQTVASGAGSSHTHALTLPTVSATGEPQNLVLRPWFRV